MPKMSNHDRNEEVINTLQDGLQPLIRYIMYRLSRIGEDVLLTKGFRSESEQLKEFLEGDSFVLWPNSFHNQRAAVDVVPVRFGIPWKLKWGAKRRFRRIASVFQQHGFEWGYKLWDFDQPHMQYSKHFSLADYKVGVQIDKNDYIKDIEDLLDAEELKIMKVLNRTTGKRKERLQKELRFFVGTKYEILA